MRALLGRTSHAFLCRSYAPVVRPQRGTLITKCSAAMSTTLQYCLVHNGEVVPCDIDSKDWLKSAPRGAYTTARTIRGDMVFMLSSHVQRLATSANLMMDADMRATDHLAGDTPLFHSDSLRPLVVGSMRVAVQELKQRTASDSETKLTLLLTWSSDGQLDLWCHAEPLLPRPKPPVKVLVKGLPRVNAKAKDSEWVRQRQVLEAAKPPDVNEVILVTPDGALTEGLTSNFFVLSAEGEVLTANEGALSGTVREVALQVCAERSIPVKLQAPRLSDIDSWQGVFITSTSRLLLPVCEVMYETEQGQLKSKAFAQQHPVVQALDAEVVAKVVQCSEPLSSEPYLLQQEH